MCVCVIAGLSKRTLRITSVQCSYTPLFKKTCVRSSVCMCASGLEEFYAEVRLANYYSITHAWLMLLLATQCHDLTSTLNGSEFILIVHSMCATINNGARSQRLHKDDGDKGDEDYDNECCGETWTQPQILAPSTIPNDSLFSFNWQLFTF